MKNTIILPLFTLLAIISTVAPINAQSQDAYNANKAVVENNSDLSEYSPLVLREPVYIDFANERIDLYVEYESISEALESFYKEYRIILESLQTEFKLAAFNEENATVYFESFLESLGTFNYGIDSDTISNFRRFFDILEGTMRNKDIVVMVDELNTTLPTKQKKSLLKNQNLFATQDNLVNSDDLSQLIDLALIISTHNPLFKEFNEAVQNEIVPLSDMQQPTEGITTFGLTGTAKNKAIAYAAKHANSRNGNYYSFSADCTNFASQILEGAGVKQSVSTSENSGWWHKMVTTSWELTHKHSISWVRADTFARYMGVGKKANNIRALGDMVVAGDFIAADWSGNGIWNHIAFITAVDSYSATYSDGKGANYYYRDFKVAQHTRDYNLWTSNNGNGWENFDSGQIVALVRR